MFASCIILNDFGTGKLTLSIISDGGTKDWSDLILKFPSGYKGVEIDVSYVPIQSDTVKF